MINIVLSQLFVTTIIYTLSLFVCQQIEANNVGLVTDFSTTNPDTVENVIQVGEIVTLNITISPPEVCFP